MKLSSILALGLFTAAAFVSRVQAQVCYDEYKIYDIYGAPSQELAIADGYGVRSIKAELVNENNCPPFPSDPTGSETGGTGASGLTTVSIYPDNLSYGQLNNGDCRINNSSTGGETSHWWPLAGLKVTAPGWRFQPQEVMISDVDMEGGSNPDDSLRKGALVFGFNGNNVVPARWTFPSGSKLIQHDMKVESDELNLLGFTRANGDHSHLPGVMSMWRYEPFPLLRCNKGAEDPACSAAFSFDEPIEGFYILHALEWKSLTQRDSLISVGNLKLECGCRCGNVSGTRKVTLSTATAGECTQKIATDDHMVCSDTGLAWCSRSTYDRYFVTGDVLPNGNYPCSLASGQSASYVRTFQ